MKYREFKLNEWMLIGLSALLLTACGSDNGGDIQKANNPNSPNQNLGQQPVNPTPQPVTPTPVPNVNGCPQYPSQAFYSYSVTGTGTSGSAQTTLGNIVADSKLRVSIEPLASTVIQNKYTLLAGTVSLVRTKNGISTVVDSKTFPTPSTQTGADNYSYKVGVPVGYKTAPQHLDFSASLAGDYKYSIKVSGVLTDKKCNDSCSPSSAAYAGHCSAYGTAYAQYCNMYQGSGFTWTLDYLKNQWYCCDGTQVQICQQTYCGVGNLTGISNAQWSVKVRVETDNTSCIQ